MRSLVKRMDEESRESFERQTGESPDAALQRLSSRSGGELQAWLAAHPRAVELLEHRPLITTKSDGVAISTHEDELLRIEEIFGKNTTPEDYITGFERFVRENMNQVPALIAVTQRPRDLTRKELSELAGLLDEKNYSEAMLRAAYGRARNADIAAHIIGFVRQAALGDPLIPYATRVDNAIVKIEASRPWTQKQKEWLRRNNCGRACLYRKKINISTVLAGQKLGLKEVEDGIWLVSFMHYDLGYIDLEQRTLQTIDNPFGTRLSPMS